MDLSNTTVKVFKYFEDNLKDHKFVDFTSELNSIYSINTAEEINMIEKGDPIEAIKVDLIKIKRAFETLEKIGINKDIMIAYIRTKGIPMSTINNVLYYQDEFFEKLGVK